MDKKEPHITDIQKVILALFKNVSQVSGYNIFSMVRRVFPSTPYARVEKALMDLKEKNLVSPSIYMAHCRVYSLKEFRELINTKELTFEDGIAYILNEDFLQDMQIHNENFPWGDFSPNTLVAWYNK